jgi:hypothetical protein
MPSRFVRRIVVAAITAGILLTAGLAMQTRASAVHDRVVVAPSAALTTAGDDQLVAAADAVFVGRVEAVEPVEVVGANPYTCFDVTVIDVMKGTVADRLTLAQLGGAIPAQHERVVVSGDSLLQSGQVYLFSAQRSPALGKLVVIPGRGHIDLAADVPNPRALTAESARTIPRVARMRAVMDLRPLN